MKKKRILILLLLIVFCFSTSLFAATITLKRGKKIRGEIIKRTGEYIKVQTPDLSIPLTFYLNDIESIDGQDPLSPSAKDTKNDIESIEGEKESSAESNLQNELINFLKSRIPTPQEDASVGGNLLIEIKPAGQEKPNLFILPYFTVIAFENYLFSARKFSELIEFCDAALKVKPDIFSFYLKAEAFEITGDINKALETYKNAVASSPDTTMFYFRIWGIYAYDKNDVTKANEYLIKFDSLLQSSKQMSSLKVKNILKEDLTNMGNYFLNETRQFDKAVKYFKMILKLDPNDDRANFNLAITKLNKSIELEDRDGFEEAVEEIRTIEKTTKDSGLIPAIREVNGKTEQIRKEAFGD